MPQRTPRFFALAGKALLTRILPAWRRGARQTLTRRSHISWTATLLGRLRLIRLHRLRPSRIRAIALLMAGLPALVTLTLSRMNTTSRAIPRPTRHVRITTATGRPTATVVRPELPCIGGVAILPKLSAETFEDRLLTLVGRTNEAPDRASKLRHRLLEITRGPHRWKFQHTAEVALGRIGTQLDMHRELMLPDGDKHLDVVLHRKRTRTDRNHR